MDALLVHASWARDLARGLVADTAAADDLVQEAWVAALESPPRHAENLRGWLGTVIRNLARSHGRSHARRAAREARVALEDHQEAPSSEALASRIETQRRLVSAVLGLDEPYRSAVILRFYEGLDATQIANRLGVAPSTARWRIKVGLDTLRERLDRDFDGDRAAWVALVLPIARPRLASASTTAVAASTLPGLLALKLSTKAAVFVAVALLAITGIALVVDPPPGEGEYPEDALAPVTFSPLEESAPRVVQGDSMDASRESVEDAPSAPATGGLRRPEPESAGGVGAPVELAVYGRVVDQAGRPVEGALVYLVPPSAGDSASAKPGEVAAEGTTDARGAFRFDGIAPLLEVGGATGLDLGVTANGFLRQVLTGALDAQPAGGWLVVLAPGRRLTGRVVDPDGRGVSGLALLAHTYAAGLQHVSLSQTALYAERAARSDGSSRYQQCRARTDAAGRVTFTGLDEGDLRVRSMDPSWILTEPTKVRADDGDVLWIAERTIAVRLEVVDARSGRAVERARATFRYELTFEDGETIDLGQYVGRGAGRVIFAIDSQNTPQIRGRTVTRVVFHGTARSGVGETAWRSEPLEDPLGVRGLVEVRVELDPSSSSEIAGSEDLPAPAPLPRATLELDVRFEDGTPVDTPLAIDWEGRAEDGRREEGSERTGPFMPGRYRVFVPAGEVELRVQERFASGSLDPWRGETQVTPGTAARVYVTLSKGATAVLRRPEGFDGTWHVRASWRASADEDWFGSWNHGTDEDALRLEALRPAEWRFELRRDAAADGPALVRFAILTAGQVLSIE